MKISPNIPNQEDGCKPVVRTPQFCSKCQTALRLLYGCPKCTQPTTWQPAPRRITNETPDIDECLVWVADARRDDGKLPVGRWVIGRIVNGKPRASGYMGDWKITFWHPLPGRPE